MMKKLLLSLILALVSAGAVMAEDAVAPETKKEAPALVAPANDSCVQLGEELPLFTAKAGQRITSCSANCIAEFNLCRAACTDRICLGECGDALDVCLANC